MGFVFDLPFILSPIFRSLRSRKNWYIILEIYPRSFVHLMIVTSAFTLSFKRPLKEYFDNDFWGPFSIITIQNRRPRTIDGLHLVFPNHFYEVLNFAFFQHLESFKLSSTLIWKFCIFVQCPTTKIFTIKLNLIEAIWKMGLKTKMISTNQIFFLFRFSVFKCQYILNSDFPHKSVLLEKQVWRIFRKE